MTTHQKLIKSKLNLLDLASYLGNVNEACRTLGLRLLKTPSDEMDSSDVNDQVGIIVPGSLAGMHGRSPP